MTKSEENFGFGDRRLSLIDVSFEDDCLYTSPSRDFPIHKFSDDPEEHKSNDGQSSAEAVEGGEQILQPVESVEPEGIGKNGKYNLRKSLAWDSAFFTSAGVLEPEELSSMIGGAGKGGKHVLPGIEEDVHRSTESISTLASDNLTLENLEADLFGNIRASIQKSSKASNVSNSTNGVEIVTAENQLQQSSEKVNTASQRKLKTKVASKKPVTAVKGSEKIKKHVSVCPPASQSVTKNEESTPSVNKSPMVIGKVSPISMAATKRASLAANHVKVEKHNARNSIANSDNAKILTGRGVKGPASSGSRNTVPKPTVGSKSSNFAVAVKMGLGTSSSFDSSASLSSDSSGKSSLNSIKRKFDSGAGTGTHTSSGSTNKNTSKPSLKKRNQLITSSLSPNLKSVAKLHSNKSPATSISEWSSELLSPTSTLNKRSNSSRPSLDKDPSGNGNAFKVLGSQSYSNDKCSIGHGIQITGSLGESVKRALIRGGALPHQESKPTGLRMPSPKIGFFDGVRSVARTPTGSVQSNPSVFRFGGENVSPTKGSKMTKFGKLQPARTVTAVHTRKMGAQHPAVGTKVKSPFCLQGSNAAPKVSGASGNARSSPGMSPRQQNKLTHENSAEINLKPDRVASNSNIGSPSVLKDKLSADSKSNAHVKDSKRQPAVENISLSQKVGEDAICNGNYNMDNMHSRSSTKKKQNASFEDLVDDMTKQVGAVDINREIQKEPLGDCCSLSQVKLSKLTQLSPSPESSGRQTEENIFQE